MLIDCICNKYIEQIIPIINFYLNIRFAIIYKYCSKCIFGFYFLRLFDYPVTRIESVSLNSI